VGLAGVLALSHPGVVVDDLQRRHALLVAGGVGRHLGALVHAGKAVLLVVDVVGGAVGLADQVAVGVVQDVIGAVATAPCGRADPEAE